MEANAHQAPQSGPPKAPELTTVKVLPSQAEQAELNIVRAIANVMDEAVPIPGTKLTFGLDALLGLIPGIGDLGSAAVSAYLIRAAQRLNVPSVVQFRMLLNILADTLIGLVPVVGDYLDILFKANVKNARLILDSVENRGSGGRSSWLVVIGMFLALVAIVVGGFVGTIMLARWAWNLAG